MPGHGKANARSVDKTRQLQVTLPRSQDYLVGGHLERRELGEQPHDEYNHQARVALATLPRSEKLLFCVEGRSKTNTLLLVVTLARNRTSIGAYYHDGEM